MRIDLGSMSTGRAAAQASHAANAFWHKFGVIEEAKQWASQTTQGFGTAIVLGASLEEITKIASSVHSKNGVADLVVDPDYAISIPSEVVPFLNPNNKSYTVEKSDTDPNKYILHRSEYTCGYVFGNKEELQPVLGHLPLYS